MRLMTKIVSIFILVSSMLAPNLALSHSGHGSPLNDAQAIEKATEYTGIIVERPVAIEGQTLDASWIKATDRNIYKKDLRYFVVSLYNAEKEKTLYMLMNTYGEYLGGNFNGTFEGL